MSTTLERIAERAPDATAPRPRSVYECIVAVAGEMAREGIAKTRNNAQQGYKFRGIDEVMNALAPMLAKYKLLILPRVLSRESVERVTQKGGTLFYVTVECEFDFVSAEDGSKHTVKTYGEAMDSADKATNKAMSAAYKYAAFQTFCIPTEGDNDADAHTHEVSSSRPQAAQPPRPDMGTVGKEPAAGTVENPGTLPPGVIRILDYRLNGEWHEILVPDAHGGTMKLSTKFAATGLAAEAAYQNEEPVRISWEPKKNGRPGEGYLKNVAIYEEEPF